MPTLTVEISDTVKQFVDCKIQAGVFKDTSAVVHALFDVAIRAEQRSAIDKQLLDALEEVERGECAPWQPEEDRKLLQAMILQRLVNAKT